MDRIEAIWLTQTGGWGNPGKVPDSSVGRALVRMSFGLWLLCKVADNPQAEECRVVPWAVKWDLERESWDFHQRLTGTSLWQSYAPELVQGNAFSLRK